MDLWDFLGCSFLPSENICGLDFSPWAYGFGVFLSLFFSFLCLYVLGDSGVLSHGAVFGFFYFSLFWTLWTFWTLNIDIVLLHMGTYIAERWHRAHGFVCDGAFGPLF